jgi:sulfite exporter TauE/SafE
MRHSRMWSFAVAGLALGSLGMVGGTAVGGELGPMTVGYSLLIAVCALYLVAGLAIRERVWQRLSRPDTTSARPDRLAGRRVF